MRVEITHRTLEAFVSVMPRVLLELTVLAMEPVVQSRNARPLVMPLTKYVPSHARMGAALVRTAPHSRTLVAHSPNASSSMMMFRVPALHAQSAVPPRVPLPSTATTSKFATLSKNVSSTMIPWMLRVLVSANLAPARRGSIVLVIKAAPVTQRASAQTFRTPSMARLVPQVASKQVPSTTIAPLTNIVPLLTSVVGPNPSVQSSKTALVASHAVSAPRPHVQARITAPLMERATPQVTVSFIETKLVAVRSVPCVRSSIVRVANTAAIPVSVSPWPSAVFFRIGFQAWIAHPMVPSILASKEKIARI